MKQMKARKSVPSPILNQRKKLQKEIEAIVNRSTDMTAEQVSSKIAIVFSEEGIISRDSFIKLLDARWDFNGVRQVEQLYNRKRLESIKVGHEDLDLYHECVDIFEEALE